MKLRRLLALLVIGFSVNAFAQCAAFPCVVASVSLINQAQAIPATPIFTPAAVGIFRVSTYINTSNGTNNNASWEVFEGWTDDLGARMGGFVYAAPNFASSSTSIVKMVAGQPLLYQAKLVRPLGGSGGMTYNLNMIVEQLQ